jgi:Fe2+ transport system protein B
MHCLKPSDWRKVRVVAFGKAEPSQVNKLADSLALTSSSVPSHMSNSSRSSPTVGSVSKYHQPNEWKLTTKTLSHKKRFLEKLSNILSLVISFGVLVVQSAQLLEAYR